MALELLRETLMRGIGFGDDEQARGVLVQSMHDAGPLDAANAGKTASAMGDERINERPGSMSGRRMHDEPRRLIYHDQIIVFIDDGERNVLAPNVRFFGRRQANRVGFARFDRRARLPYRPAAR